MSKSKHSKKIRSAKIGWTLSMAGMALTLLAATPGKAADIRLAVIGDSYTVGVGDACDMTSCTYAQPGMTGYSSGQNNGIPYWITAPEPMAACGQYASWPAKLAYKLITSGHQASVVHVCARNGATSQEMYARNCGNTIQSLSPAPTHVLIYAGLNDPNTQTTWYWVNEIGKQITNPAIRKIHIQARGASKTPNWDVLVTGFLNGNVNHSYPGATQIPFNQCNAHPTGNGYWTLANNIFNAVQW